MINRLRWLACWMALSMVIQTNCLSKHLWILNWYILILVLWKNHNSDFSYFRWQRKLFLRFLEFENFLRVLRHAFLPCIVAVQDLRLKHHNKSRIFPKMSKTDWRWSSYKQSHTIGEIPDGHCIAQQYGICKSLLQTTHFFESHFWFDRRWYFEFAVRQNEH